MISIIFLWGVILFCSIPLGLFILNNLKVSFLSRSFDKFIISFWIGISIIALIQLFLSGWVVLTFWFPLAFSLLSLSLIQNRQINSELKIWWKNFFLKKSIFWVGVFSTPSLLIWDGYCRDGPVKTVRNLYDFLFLLRNRIVVSVLCKMI